MGTFRIFFFQAEDGIRDVAVTGVQTCALPIWRSGSVRSAAPVAPQPVAAPAAARPRRGAPLRGELQPEAPRSEERRVGKEGRTRAWPLYLKKKQKVSGWHL